MRIALTLSLAGGLALAACASKPSASAGGGGSAAGQVRSAVATLSPAAAGGALGIVTFAASGAQVDVHVLATGLAPGSVHGFHVHENGNCASPDFMGAGGHFNPGKQPHGPQDGPHHLGDMPSLLVDPTGRIDARFMLAGATLTGAGGYVGHAVILHAGPDDYQTQPTGNSGGRISCGVIAAQ
ncbi:MAG: superoxide dismutase family protein [Burkholderiaceae bacterium]